MSNMTQLDMGQIPIVIHFGDMTLDFGVGTIPLIFLRFYRYIEGLNSEHLRDAEAMLLVHVLALRADHDFELRLENIPAVTSTDRLRKFTAKFRRMGLVFTSRVYYSRSEMEEWFGAGNAPTTPRLKAQRWDLSSLFFTLSLIGRSWLERQQAAIAEWKTGGERGPKPIYKFPDNYTQRVELPFNVAQRIINGEYFPTPPDYILNLAKRICSSVPGQNDPVRASHQVKVTHAPGQNDPVRAPYQVKMTRSSNTTATAAGRGECELCQFYLRLAGIDGREPTEDELQIIRQLLADGISQDTITAGIERAFQTRRYADGIPTLAQCARIVRRLHHRKHRENDARTTDCPAAAGESTTGEVAASGLAAPADQSAVDQAAAGADPLADVWAVLREGSCSERDYDTAANRLGLRHLPGEPEQVYQAVIEAITYGVPPDRLVGYVRRILERWAAEAQAQDAVAETEAEIERQVITGSPLPAGDQPSTATEEQPFDSAQDKLWETALTELRLQMTKATFDTWLVGSRLVSADDGTCIIAVCSEYARVWLENRLKSVVARTLAAVLGHEVEVQFVVTEEALQGSGPV